MVGDWLHSILFSSCSPIDHFIIGGYLKPDSGDVKVEEKSIYHDLRQARASFGVCPQFTAIDAQLTVHEHLYIYARLRGLSVDVLERDIGAILQATGLNIYADRLASKLSGGNQRKLALAIALVGNPPVILVDEYSTGIDARMKRELWAVLKQITRDKAVLLTTRMSSLLYLFETGCSNVHTSIQTPWKKRRILPPRSESCHSVC